MAQDEEKHASAASPMSPTAIRERLATLRREKARLEENLGSVEREIDRLTAKQSEGGAAKGESVARLDDSGDRRPEETPAAEAAKSLADRSTWSPKLRSLIERMFPEEGKQERIRMATESTRTVSLGKGLPREVIRYYAEDVDLEYDG